MARSWAVTYDARLRRILKLGRHGMDSDDCPLMTAERNAKMIYNALEAGGQVDTDPEFPLCRLVERCLQVFDTRQRVPRSVYWAEAVVGWDTWDWWHHANGDTIREFTLALVNAARVRKAKEQSGESRTPLYARLDRLSQRLAEERTMWYTGDGTGKWNPSYGVDFDNRAEDEADVAAKMDDEVLLRGIAVGHIIKGRRVMGWTTEGGISHLETQAAGVPTKDGQPDTKGRAGCEADVTLEVLEGAVVVEKGTGMTSHATPSSDLSLQVSPEAPGRYSSCHGALNRRDSRVSKGMTDAMRAPRMKQPRPRRIPGGLETGRGVLGCGRKIKLPIRPRNNLLLTELTANAFSPFTRCAPPPRKSGLLPLPAQPCSVRKRRHIKYRVERNTTRLEGRNNAM